MVSAVMKDASSEARNAATAAMSSTEPNLLIMVLSVSSFLCRIIQVRYIRMGGTTGSRVFFK